LPLIGWREWVALPDLSVPTIKVKIDTGARSSALHAYDVEEFRRQKQVWVRFAIHPRQRSRQPEIVAEAPLLEYRVVRSSLGQESYRPVIITTIELLDSRWPIELTLVDRDAMGFRMLLGRQAVRGRFLIHPGRSFLAGRK
jgi:hypothetical protein